MKFVPRPLRPEGWLQTEESKRRDARALDMREAGHTYAEVGRAFGVSRTRATHLVAQEELRRKAWTLQACRTS